LSIKTRAYYFKNILQLSYPIIIGQVGIVLMGVADVLMIGKLDATNLAAAGLANAVYFLISIIGIGTLTAISPLIAKSKAENNLSEVKSIYKQGIRAAMVLGIAISIVIEIIAFNMHWLGQTEQMTSLAATFLHLLNTSTIFLFVFLAAKQFSDGLSYTKVSAIVTIAGLLLNIGINYLLIYGHYGFPKMGLSGAGVATSITRFMMMCAMLLLVNYHHLYTPFLSNDIKTSNQSKALRTIFSVGLPSGFQYFFEIGAFTIAAIIIGWFGENHLAAHNIAINMASVTYMIATGISVGGSITVGDAWGRRDADDIRKSGKTALLMSIIFMGAMALLFTFFNNTLVALYIKSNEVAEIAKGLLLIAALFQLSDGIQCVSLGILRGLSDTKVPTIITVIAYWVIGLPVGLLLAYHFNLTTFGIWYGLSIGLTFSAVMLSMRFINESKSIEQHSDNPTKF
jgi:MATE family multidrug resistance protein